MSGPKEKLFLMESIVSAIADAIQETDSDNEIRDMFVDSCAFRQVVSKWRDPTTHMDLLQLAVKNKRQKLVKFLCKPESKFVPWAPVHDVHGRTINSPFHIACKVGSLDIIRFLLEYENSLADLMLLRTAGYVCFTSGIETTDKPMLPFEICVEEKHSDCCMFLCHYILSACIFKDTPEKLAMLNASSLHQACHIGSAKLLDLLLIEPAWSRYINSYDSLGFTPLHIAAMCTDSQCLQLLLKHESNINIYADCRSVLHILYSYKRKPEHFVTCTEILIQHGADVNASDHNENTPLDYVAYEFGQKVVKNPNMHRALSNVYVEFDNHKTMERSVSINLQHYRQELLQTMELLLRAGAHTHTVISSTRDGVLVDHTIIHTLLQNTGWPLSSCLLSEEGAADVYTALQLLFRYGCDANVLAKHNLTSAFSTLLLHGLHEVQEMHMKLRFIHLFISYGTNLHCIIPPPRNFRKHPTDRIWSVPPLILALQEKHPLEIISCILDYMTIPSVNRALRSSKMHQWYTYVLLGEPNTRYRKEWVGLKHSMRNNVRSLKHHCKLKILGCLGGYTSLSTNLPIPSMLKQYVRGIHC